jgi:hypothetical protein
MMLARRIRPLPLDLTGDRRQPAADANQIRYF